MVRSRGRDLLITTQVMSSTQWSSSASSSREEVFRERRLVMAMGTAEATAVLAPQPGFSIEARPVAAVGDSAAEEDEVRFPDILLTAFCSWERILRPYPLPNGEEPALADDEEGAEEVAAATDVVAAAVVVSAETSPHPPPVPPPPYPEPESLRERLSPEGFSYILFFVFV